MRTTLITAAALLLLGLVAPAPSLVRADEFQDQARALRKKAAELKEQGRFQAAEDLARKTAELAENERPPQQQAKFRPNVAKQEVAKLEGLLKGLLDKERRIREGGASLEVIATVEEQILDTERELDKLRSAIKSPLPAARSAEIPPQAMAKLEKAGLQIKHMYIAADNLEAAGATELAGQIRDKTKIFEREARAAKAELLKSVAPQEGPELASIRAEVAALRKEVAQLRTEVERIGQQRKKSERAKNKKK